MAKRIIEYTCFFLSVIFAFVIAVYVQFDINILNKVVALLTIILLGLGIASVIVKNARKSPTIRSKSESTVNLALAPEEKAQEIIDITKDVRKVGKQTMEKLKKFLHWCNLYKSQLIGFVGSFAASVFTTYITFTEWFNKNVMALLPDYCKTGYWFQILIVIVIALLTALAIRNQAAKVGVGSIEYAEKVLNDRTKGDFAKLSDASKKQIRDSIKELKKKIDLANKELLSKEKEINDLDGEIKSDNELLCLGLKNADEINQLTYKKNELATQVETKKQEIKAQEDTVSKYQNALNR